MPFLKNILENARREIRSVPEWVGKKKNTNININIELFYAEQERKSFVNLSLNHFLRGVCIDKRWKFCAVPSGPNLTDSLF